MALVATLGLPLTSNADDVAPLVAGELPATIPALDWTDAEGQWTLTDESRIVAPAEFAPRAEVFAAELDVYLNPSKAATELVPATPGAVEIATSGADTDDIEIVLDAARDGDLGVEGYELEIASDGVTITAADQRGAFYGTRSLSQLLRQQLTLSAGSSLDVPKYEERGVTLCACQINIQNDFIDRMLTDMADLKLNHLLLEMKLETEDDRNNTWSYYTKDDVRELVEKADLLGIDVIPEINSPGHMGIWLTNRPDLQLRNNAGNPGPNQLDLSHPDAFEFYTGLIDEYMGVFTTDYWHMGADEYMIGTTFANYNALTAWAKDQHGPDATIGDAFIDFINSVNEYVKTEHGKKLRIWNDGIISTEVIQLDEDIVVEYWDGSGLRPATLIERGYELMNANGALYFSRSNLGFKMNSQNLWNSDWHVGIFPGANGVLDPDDDHIRGAKVSIWPDSSHWQTENEVEAEVFEGLRFISQLTWQGNHEDSHGQDMDWATFSAGIEAIDRNPLWLNVDRRPLADGMYSFTLNDSGSFLGADADTGLVADEKQVWQLTSSHDYYYTLKNLATGQCLAVTEGVKRLDVVTEVGAETTMVECTDPNDTAHNTAPARNPLKWAIIPSGDGFTLRNALTNQDLSVIKGTETAIDFSADPTEVDAMDDQSLRPATGTLAQLPPHIGSDVFVPATELGAIASTSASVIHPGVDAEINVQVSASVDAPLNGVVVQAPSIEGLTFEPASVTIGDVAAGETATASFTLSTSGVQSTNGITFEIAYDGGTTTAGVLVTSTCGPSFTPTGLGASSEALGETAPNGRWAAAFDGDPGTFWHSEWSGTPATYPHWLSMDAGETMTLCGVTLTPRQSSPNGRVKDVNVYVSDAPFGEEKATWGEPVTTVTLPDNATDKAIAFEPVEGRYVIVEGTSNYPAAANDVWMTMGEVALTGTSADVPGPTAGPTTTVTATPPTPTVTTTTTATATATATTTTTATATMTATATATTTATATATATATSTSTRTVEVTATPTSAPTTSRPADGSWIYVTPGYHDVNGRQWFTECEPYSQTFRCTTQIIATTVVATATGFEQKTGWVFNNLTYLPKMTRAQWGTNPLANTGEWSSEGRQWRTECDTANTGRGGCRSYIDARVVEATTANGQTSYRWVTKEVFNSMVLFKS